jgi:hypothetical protein
MAAWVAKMGVQIFLGKKNKKINKKELRPRGAG